ncbi:hypothetical protein [Thermoplasma volcanium GSS1]|uniref:Pyridoxal 5'-phosphate synthase subunit PdxT n=1 Tax=Thermoplasma volcanium (strain ATCC 51530 / DSM 4299 / JCM 9571 / NBRC 15438 / GSS1) TaxID=273116 RepID=PDXT_THEVO|nr:pyridoxal 5'-phosphate synthase glutaminase subunit PdxT [Thermoplasma volcanium]Q97CP5.1 RecName: Full=Pyridoxal 5'-phosphate synthase subunit PdxT; AltName: Full=Pdx2; AltName: Full=Pyridoxal 5'-phosphate synthase glutaminase subunit [Thermoplasma volcanium GSS1]BAB59198.1 hypothetical protein [Thermoplasma volcanium GSS1]
MNVGIIGFQGDVEEHIAIVKKISRRRKGINVLRIRRKEDLDRSDSLIIPGGESTTIYKLISEYGIYDEIIRRAKEGMPVMATCAGLILISKDTNDDRVPGMNLLDVTIMRNAYGRQVNSFETDIDIKGIGTFHAVFIRAPRIKEYGNVDVMASLDGYPVMVRSGNILGMTFHPELTGDVSIHEYFLSMGGGGYISTATG